MGEFQSVRLRPLSPEIDNPTATRTATEKSAAFCPADYCAGTMAVLQSGILGLPLKQLNEGIAVTKPRGTQLLQQLPGEARTQLLAAGREMARLALHYAVPIVLAPPLGVEGKISSATGFGVRRDSGTFIGTAHHVLYGEEGYVERIRSDDRVNWQVGNLPPFDPLSRIAWEDENLDVVFLRISEREAAAVGPCIISSPSKWPPDPPQIGELVLIGGYPRALREENREEGWIGIGPLSAVFQVTDFNEPFYGCVVVRDALVSFDGPCQTGRNFKITEVAQLGDHRLRRRLVFRGRDVYKIEDRTL